MDAFWSWMGHVSDEFLLICQKHRVWIACLPAHSSHITQPLDLSVFCSLKTRYRQYTDDVALTSAADSISKEDFLFCYARAREGAFSARNIRSGWKQAGLWPVDVTVLLANPRLFPSKEEVFATTPQKPRETQETQQEAYKTFAAKKEGKGGSKNPKRDVCLDARDCGGEETRRAAASSLRCLD